MITKYINVLSKREIFTYFRPLFCYQEAANIILIEAPTANDDLKCDEMGCCECVGVRNGHFKRKSSKAKKVSERKCHREDVFKLTRRYYSNESLPSLKKITKTEKNSWQHADTDKSIYPCDKFELVINYC